MPLSSGMQVPLLDLKPQYQSLKAEILPRLEALFESQDLVLGETVGRFERTVCGFTGAAHAIGMSSGTDAILAVLMALEIGPDDAVLTTPYTFFATSGCIARVGAEPVFVDIDPDTANLCASRLADFVKTRCTRSAEGVLRAPSGRRIKAVMPVHLYGLCCELDDVAQVARENGLPLIEDAAQALGSVYPGREGALHHAGAYGEFGCYSFYPTKNLGGFGDGGMVVCRDAAMAAKLRAIRNHGMEDRYYHKIVGGNFRLDGIQAAVLEIKLRHLDAWSAARRANAAIYREILDGIATLPSEPYAARTADPRHHIFNQFVIRTPHRDALMEHLRSREIGCAIYYPLPLHRQDCFAALGYQEGDFPVAEQWARESLALPIFPELGEHRVRHAAETIAAFRAE